MAHPLLVVLARAQTRQALRKSGHGLLDAIALSKEVDDDMVSAALAESSDETRAALSVVGALGDGMLLQKFLDFLNSDLGKALIALIMKLLLGV